METDSEVPLALLSIVFLSVYLFIAGLQYSSSLKSTMGPGNTNTSFSNFNQLASFIKYLPIIGLSISGSFLAIELVDGFWIGLTCGFVIVLGSVFLADFLIYKAVSYTHLTLPTICSV